jgi:hypothetical protein
VTSYQIHHIYSVISSHIIIAIVTYESLLIRWGFIYDDQDRMILFLRLLGHSLPLSSEVLHADDGKNRVAKIATSVMLNSLDRADVTSKIQAAADPLILSRDNPFSKAGWSKELSKTDA